MIQCVHANLILDSCMLQALRAFCTGDSSSSSLLSSSLLSSFLSSLLSSSLISSSLLPAVFKHLVWCMAVALPTRLRHSKSVPPLELRAELVLDSVGSLTLLPKTQMLLQTALANKQNAHCLLVFEIGLTKRASHGKSYLFRAYQCEELLQSCWLFPNGSNMFWLTVARKPRVSSFDLAWSIHRPT